MVSCHKEHRRNMLVALSTATIPVMQQKNVRICKQYRKHEEYTDKAHLPLHGQVSCMSQPRCYNPVFPHWGHSAPLSTFFQMPHYLSSAMEGISQEKSHRDLRTGHLIVPQVPAEAQGTSVKLAGQPLFCCLPSMLSSWQNLPLRRRAMD